MLLSLKSEINKNEIKVDINKSRTDKNYRTNYKIKTKVIIEFFLNFCINKLEGRTNKSLRMQHQKTD